LKAVCTLTLLLGFALAYDISNLLVDFYILVSLDVVDYFSCMDLVLVDREHIAVSLFTFFPGKKRRKKFGRNIVGIDFISVPLCLVASRCFSCSSGHK
jgi:hypothetical protein